MKKNAFYLVWLLGLLLWAAGFICHVPDISHLVGAAAIFAVLFLKNDIDRLGKQYVELLLKNENSKFVMSTYYDWISNTQNCGACGWVGTGKETIIGDFFDSGAEYHCPKCNHLFGYKPYPLISDVQNDPRADPIDRIALEIAGRNKNED
jgi:hypothetical protein